MGQNTILVVMPAYNAEDTIAAAISSILDQTHQDIRLVVIDDASADGTLDVAKQFLGDVRFRLYKNKINMGAYYGRNFGLWVSRDMSWNFFTTHDADDISFLNRFKSHIGRFQKRPSVIGIQDMFDRIDTKTGRTVKSKLTMAHAIFRREAFDSIGYFDNVRFGADWEHWYRLNTFTHFKNGTKRTISVEVVMGESYIHDSNLTIQIPEGSPKRQKYSERAKKKIDGMPVSGKWYYDFEPEKGLTRKVS